MNDKPILLKDIWQIENTTAYKVHFARQNEGGKKPLDVWVHDKAAWYKWQEYYPDRNDFNREFIFSLMQFYHVPDTWLFGGIFRVINLLEDRYEVELTEQGESYVGRLILHSSYRSRPTRVKFENHYASFHVHEILRNPYSGEKFPGYENIDLSFGELESLIKNNRREWDALKYIQGVYLITDTKTNKRYVGSAYGDSGIWSRWGSYIDSGHGGNTELKSLLERPGRKYCYENFRFTLLEYHSVYTPDKIVAARESFWKKILLTRKKFGYNKN